MNEFIVAVLIAGFFAWLLVGVLINPERDAQVAEEYEDRRVDRLLTHLQNSEFFRDTNSGNCFMVSGDSHEANVTLVPCAGITDPIEFTTGD